MEKRFLLALILSLIVLLGYPYLISRIYGPSKPTPYETESIEAEKIKESPTLPAPSFAIDSTPDMIEESSEETVEPPLLLETGELELLFHPRDGSIRQIYLKNYRDEDEEPMELANVGDKSNFIGYVWFQQPKYTTISYNKVAQTAHKLIFQGSISEGLTVEKNIELVSGYIVRLSLTFRNLTSQTIPIYYHLVAGSGLRPEPKEDRFFEALVFVEGKKRGFHFNKIVKNPVSSGEKPQWVALKQKYFSLILKPETNLSGFTILPTEEKKSMAFRVGSTPQNIPPGGTLTEDYLFYFGPNKLQELKKLGPWAEGVIDYGWFSEITKILLWALTTIHRAVRNYGLSIIILTIIVSILLFPLTRISYNSMKRMKLLQPEVNKIREMYKEKPQKMNKELMALYKRNKVNPLGGCLPMLIQMPIFIAFYQALIYSIELKGAPFLFIKDLSMPDRAIPLPVRLGPLGNAINILPILMMLAMYLQQKMVAPVVSGGPEGDTQRMMTTMMPFIFGFIFYGLPSGLVLYWLTNNIVMIVTQKLVFSRETV